MSRIFYEQYGDIEYDKDEIIKKYGRDIFESEDIGSEDGIADWMIDKAELKKAYDWALETGFLDEDDFMEVGDCQWCGLLDIYYAETKPQYDIYKLSEVTDENGNKVMKEYMGYWGESYEDAKARHEAMNPLDLDIHYFTD